VCILFRRRCDHAGQNCVMGRRHYATIFPPHSGSSYAKHHPQEHDPDITERYFMLMQLPSDNTGQREGSQYSQMRTSQQRQPHAPHPITPGWNSFLIHFRRALTHRRIQAQAASSYTTARSRAEPSTTSPPPAASQATPATPHQAMNSIADNRPLHQLLSGMRATLYQEPNRF